MLLAYWSLCITPHTPLCPLPPWSLSAPGVWALYAGDTAFKGNIRLENTELAKPSRGDHGTHRRGQTASLEVAQCEHPPPLLVKTALQDTR